MVGVNENNCNTFYIFSKNNSMPDGFNHQLQNKEVFRFGNVLIE